LRILAVASAPVLGGAEIFLFRISAELERRQVPITLAVAEGAAAVDGPWRTLGGPRTPNALRRRGLGSVGVLRRSAWGRWLEVLTRARREGAEVLVLQYPAEQAALTVLARGLGYRVIWVVHSRLPFALARQLLGGRLRRAARSAEAVFVISGSTRQALVAAGWPEGIMRTLTPCVGVDTVPAAACHAQRRIIVLSRLTRKKGVHLVLGAAARLRAAFPDLTVTVAGEGRGGRRLRRLAARLGIESAVNFVGFTAEPQRLLAAGGILVHATYDEGDSIPTVLLEAGLAGLPVVTTAWNGSGEVVEDNASGLLVEPRSVTALVDALRPLLADPSRRAEMGRRGRQRVLARYTVDRVVDRILAELSGDGIPG
jgi:glycosyltransferase involved in cell wall biosynthesis